MQTTMVHTPPPPPIHYKDLESLYVTYKEKLLNINIQTNTKQLYNFILTEQYDRYEIFAETTWNSTFKKEIPWQKLWKQNFASFATGKTHDTLFKIMHNCLPTKTRLKKNHHKRGNYSEKCKYCKKTENTLYVFAKCKIAAKIWKTYQPIYEKLLPNIPFFYEEAVISLNLIDTKITRNTRKLTLTLTNTNFGHQETNLKKTIYLKGIKFRGYLISRFFSFDNSRVLNFAILSC